MGDSDRSDFMKTVEEIKLAEEESDEILKAAKIKADKILRKAKEEVQIHRAKTEEEIVALKNKLLEEGSKEIESEVQAILSKAKKQADEIRTKKLAKKDSTVLVNTFLISE
jgi:vacuolar-type H+-ATPase subunit H